MEDLSYEAADAKEALIAGKMVMATMIRIYMDGGNYASPIWLIVWIVFFVGTYF